MQHLLRPIPVIEHATPVNFTVPASVMKDTAPVSAVSSETPIPMIENVTPAPVDALNPVIKNVPESGKRVQQHAVEQIVAQS